MPSQHLRVHRRRRAWLAAPLVLLGWSLVIGQDDRIESETPERHVEYGDIVRIFSGDAEVPRDVERHGSMVLVGGHARIDGELYGDVVVILGSLDVRGRVRGQVVGILTDLTLDEARVDDQVVSVLGQLDRSGLVHGDRVVHIGFPGVHLPGIWTLLTWWRLLKLLVVFLLLVLLTVLVPERVRAIAEEAPVRYVQAFFVGLLGYIAAVAVMIVISVTLVGLPLAYIAFVAAKWLGVAGLFFALARRALPAGRNLSPFAAVLLVFGIYAVGLIAIGTAGMIGLAAVLVVRLVFLCMFEIPGLGLVLLTRAGSNGTVRVAPPPAAPAPSPGQP